MLSYRVFLWGNGGRGGGKEYISRTFALILATVKTSYFIVSVAAFIAYFLR